MSHSVSRKGGEGQEKKTSASPDPRKASCAHKGPGSTGGSVGRLGVEGGGRGERYHWTACCTGVYKVIQVLIKEKHK